MARGESGRLPVPILVGLALLLLLVVGSAIHMVRLTQRLSEREQTVVTLTAQNDQLQQQLTNIEEDRRNIEAKLNELKSQLSSATGEVTRLRAEMTELQGRYELLSTDKVELETRATRLAKERDDSRERARQLDIEKQDLERASSRLRERYALLDRDYQRMSQHVAEIEQQQSSASMIDHSASASMGALSTPMRPSAAMSMDSAAAASGRTAADGQTVELPPIVVRKDQTGTGLPLRARLIEVNVGHRFMVIDKGSNDGVRVGMTFDVVRGGATVAQASVVRVRPQLSACDLITARSPETPQVGDLAIQRTP